MTIYNNIYINIDNIYDDIFYINSVNDANILCRTCYKNQLRMFQFVNYFFVYLSIKDIERPHTKGCKILGFSRSESHPPFDTQS